MVLLGLRLMRGHVTCMCAVGVCSRSVYLSGTETMRFIVLP